MAVPEIRIPKGTRNSITEDKIQTGDTMINFQGEKAFGRYYKSSTYNKLNGSPFKLNPFTREPIKRISRYTAKIQESTGAKGAGAGAAAELEDILLEENVVPQRENTRRILRRSNALPPLDENVLPLSLERQAIFLERIARLQQVEDELAAIRQAGRTGCIGCSIQGGRRNRHTKKKRRSKRHLSRRR